MLYDLIRTNRSYRRFCQSETISIETLRDLIDLCRMSPSAANRQPLKYYLSTEAGENASIFPYTRWAGYLENWPGPAEGERPSAYILILGDKAISDNFHCDHGIVAQSILLGAVERGLGGCIIGSIDRSGLRKELGIPERFEILLIVALGKPIEKVVLEPLPADGDIRYYRDQEGTHHVPKRSLDDLILRRFHP